ncbi:MAG: hypothetical protein ACLTLQ_10840 [[Clostridium] scindens]
MVGNYCAEYGFKLKTDQRTYMLRCNPNYGDYNFYLYAYVGSVPEHHMEKAKQGIRFMLPATRRFFAFGPAIASAVSQAEEGTRDRTCRFIDETHFETSGDYPRRHSIHICEFAGTSGETHGSVIPLRSSLPPNCLSILPSSGELIIITRAKKDICSRICKLKENPIRRWRRSANHAAGVTKAQEAPQCWQASMFGWQRRR